MVANVIAKNRLSLIEAAKMFRVERNGRLIPISEIVSRAQSKECRRNDRAARVAHYAERHAAGLPLFEDDAE